jgi:hypothetical protein
MLNFYDHLLIFCSGCIATDRVITVYIVRIFFGTPWCLIIYYVHLPLCYVPTLLYNMNPFYSMSILQDTIYILNYYYLILCFHVLHMYCAYFILSCAYLDMLIFCFVAQLQWFSIFEGHIFCFYCVSSRTNTFTFSFIFYVCQAWCLRIIILTLYTNVRPF